MYLLVSKKNYFSDKLFEYLSNKYSNFIYITTKDQLNHYLCDNNPYKIFFFHWSYIIPKNIVEKIECINIHTANLPYGKGGSPIQNQILDDIISSKINALKMNNKIDAGPIYTSRDITLQGNLFDIWSTIMILTFEIICDIIDNNLVPREQININNEKIYKRRNNNNIPFQDEISIEKIYNYIRMLDRIDYPDPYIEIGNYILKFSRAQFNGENILCDVKIEKKY